MKKLCYKEIGKAVKDSVKIYKKTQAELYRFGLRFLWYSLRESNPQLALRRGLLYPFN